MEGKEEGMGRGEGRWRKGKEIERMGREEIGRGMSGEGGLEGETI
jgi:hypothetical protein